MLTSALSLLGFGLLVITPIVMFIYWKMMKKWQDRIPQNHRMPSTEELRLQRLKDVWGDRLM
jgi:hypothetical protein